MSTHHLNPTSTPAVHRTELLHGSEYVEETGCYELVVKVWFPARTSPLSVTEALANLPAVVLREIEQKAPLHRDNDNFHHEPR